MAEKAWRDLLCKHNLWKKKRKRDREKKKEERREKITGGFDENGDLSPLNLAIW
uniref:Uncharacterized protein n=1 Tax=Nelumbo nucifera TaxID=4432 RepID=A0A822ZAT7_NELNU|nr:TPA_asm: hypothetical protein HUJ06_000462 [Nelumbo nucifera]